MLTTHKIIIGDSRKMQEIADETVHLVITSPPYWQLKDYGEKNQIGFNHTYEEYINNLNLVWKECHRVLHKGCRLCINIGDQFARSVYYGRYKVIPIRTEIIKFCETVGFDYMGAIIWQKVITCNTTGGATIMGSFPYPRNGILKLDYEFILIFKKYGDSPKVSNEIKKQSKLSKEEWNQYFSGHWNFSGEKQDKHLAMFPEELPKRLIKMFSFVGETILDPFAGSGTTSLVARNLARNSIGFEINPEFISMIEEKLEVNQKDINGTTYEFLKQKEEKINFESEIKLLPYIFKDPHTFDKKIDVKKLQFGSKIDKDSSTKREELYTVKEVISPNKLLLSNDLEVNLIGIKPYNCGYKILGEDMWWKANEWLKDKTKGKRVFLKYDTIKYDKENNLLCYLYLENRTFINAHLIKNGLAQVDSDIDFKYKNKFLNLLQLHNG